VCVCLIVCALYVCVCACVRAGHVLMCCVCVRACMTDVSDQNIRVFSCVCTQWKTKHVCGGDS